MPGGSILTTAAPKSDITVAAAGPAMKLAQSITLRPSKTRSPILSLQAECLAIVQDTTGGAAGEMRADDEDWRGRFCTLARARQDFLARRNGPRFDKFSCAISAN